MALTSPSIVKRLLGAHGLQPDRGFGQNFLVDTHALETVVTAAGLEPQQTVVEFGPGLGVLTQQLARHAGRVVAVELDHRLLPVLQETLAGHANVEVLHQDALEFDYTILPEGSSLVANLPYNVATPLIMAALESGRIGRIVAMVQREVAERIRASPGESGFGAFSLLMRYYASARIVRDVAPGSFYPPPEVTSSIVRLDAHPGVRPDPQLFDLIHDAFRHRRKTLRKNLIMAGYGAEDAARALEAMELDQRIRAEELSLEGFQSLRRVLLSGD